MLVGTNNHVEMLLLCLMLLGPQVFTFCQKLVLMSIKNRLPVGNSFYVNVSTKRQPSTSHDFPTKVGNQKNDQRYLQTSSIHSQSKTWFNKNKKIVGNKQITLMFWQNLILDFEKDFKYSLVIANLI